MAQAKTRRLSGLPWRALSRALTTVERARVRAELGALAAWQRTLARWPTSGAAIDATPFVTLYVRGRLAGCCGSDEGSPGERLRRAFLRALADARFDPAAARDRDQLSAQVSYLRDARPIDPRQIAAELEPGSDGLALVPAGGAPALLLPDVARDQGLDADGLLRALLAKARAGAAELELGALFAFRTESVVVHAAQPPSRASDPIELACAWMARLVRNDGRVWFAVDARRRARQELGPMHHGRISVLVRALDAHGGHRREVRAARERLRSDCVAALGGATVEGWPDDPAMVGGTLALAQLAGADVGAQLRAFAVASRELERSPWHAAQVVTALGRDAPERLWRACVEDLERRPIAPWTALAAEARGERAIVERLHAALADSLRARAPHAGGAGETGVPEIALTAIAVEALAGARSPAATAARARGRAFLRRWQLSPERISAPLDPALALGAFPASPVVEWLRADITAHAVLALTGANLDSRSDPTAR